MTRQMIRQAQRRMQRNKFPFPEFAAFVRTRMLDPKFFCISQPNNQYKTNLSGETQTLNLSDFYQLLSELAANNGVGKNR